MKKEINLFLLIILLGQFLYAQDKYDPGYVVTIKKDTIHGFILNSIDAELADKISFKRNSLDEDLKEYKPSELLGFGFTNGRVFERKKIKNDNQPIKDSSYVFAKRIVKGKIDLFIWRHKKNNSKDFFIINNSSRREARLIQPKKTSVKIDGKTYSKNDTDYKNHLTFVKQDENSDPEKITDLSFGEKSIRKDIISFNKKFQDEYPIEIYKEPTHHNYDILVGLPLNDKSSGRTFTISAFRSKNFIEKSNNLSFIYGLSYYDWRDKDENKVRDSDSQNSTINYIWQKLNVLPLGIKIQTKGKRIIPYGYIAVGGALLMMKDYHIEDYEYLGSKRELILLPAMNAGIGVKIKVKSDYIVTEITPAMNRVFLKLGYSF